MSPSTVLSTGLVLETNNLRGGEADAAQVARSLERLLSRLAEQSLPLSSLTELVVPHSGLSRAQQTSLSRAAGRTIHFVQIPNASGYYDAKNLGFDATSAEVVAFGDGDCWPEPDWLERLLAPFSDRNTQVVAGRTTYRGDVLGIAASTIDFMYFHGPLGPALTRNFYANNVAFRRSVFAAHRYQPVDGVYRGHCQLLGMQLQAKGVRIRFEPSARTVHRFPDSLHELVALRLLRGEDSVELTPHLARSYLPVQLAGLGELPLAALATLAVRLGYSFHALNRQDLPAVKGGRALACAGAILGLSALDVIGAARRILDRRPLGSRDAQSLSYHRDADRLGARPAA